MNLTAFACGALSAYCAGVLLTWAALLRSARAECPDAPLGSAIAHTFRWSLWWPTMFLELFKDD